MLYAAYLNKKGTVKSVFSGHSKRRPKTGLQDRLLLNAGQKYRRMLQESILQYFWPSLNYHFFKTLFRLFLNGHLRQVLLYSQLANSPPPPPSYPTHKTL